MVCEVEVVFFVDDFDFVGVCGFEGVVDDDLVGVSFDVVGRAVAFVEVFGVGFGVFGVFVFFVYFFQERLFEVVFYDL